MAKTLPTTPSCGPTKDDFTVRSADVPRLCEIAEAYLYATRWAGWLGEPVPKSHRALKDRRYLTQLRHRRGFCAFVSGRDDL